MRQKQRQTNRQTDRQTETDRDRQRQREKLYIIIIIMATNHDNEISHNQTQSLNEGGELTAQKMNIAKNFYGL